MKRYEGSEIVGYHAPDDAGGAAKTAAWNWSSDGVVAELRDQPWPRSAVCPPADCSVVELKSEIACVRAERACDCSEEARAICSTIPSTCCAFSSSPESECSTCAAKSTPLADRRNGLCDKLRSLFRGLASTACQIPHLIRHNCKPGTRLPSPCCLHRGVQRQDVGLESDLVDYLGNLLKLASSWKGCGNGQEHL